MGYKILGFAVWQLAKAGLRYKLREATTARNLAIAGLVGVGIAGALIATRNGDES